MIDKTIVIATSNRGKVTELSAMLDIEGVIWKSLADFDNLSEVIEDGRTFAENARKKALSYAEQTGHWVIADDSGLSIDALDGAPGVKSARFSGEKNNNKSLIDHQNIDKVLKLMQDVKERSAKFICCLCLASPEKILLESQGILTGFITENKMGKEGFGYDPIFWVVEKNKTAAQMTRKEKNAVSHRGQAVKKLKHQLKNMLKHQSC